MYITIGDEDENRVEYVYVIRSSDHNIKDSADRKRCVYSV